MPTKREIVRPVIQGACRWIVDRMRELEEWQPDADARWNRLRDTLERVARGE